MTVTEFDDITVELALPEGPLESEGECDPFVSKVGGRPALLFPSKILEDENSKPLICSRCGSPKYLLLQMDCPLDEHPGIDRVLYVFACNSRLCTESGRSGVVTSLLQCQRARGGTVPKPGNSSSGLWSGFASGSDVCDNLEKLTIKEDCHEPSGVYLKNMPVSFPPIALHIVNELIANHRLPVKKNFPIEAETGTAEDLGEAWQGEMYEKMQIAGYDKIFKAFHTRVSHYPRQLARYSPNGGPLLFNADPLPEITPCDVCGQIRRFELQLMPGILSKLPNNEPKYLGHIPKADRGKHPIYGDGMEWGTILVYSCGVCRSNTNEHCESLAQVIIQIEKD